LETYIKPLETYRNLYKTVENNRNLEKNNGKHNEKTIENLYKTYRKQ